MQDGGHDGWTQIAFRRDLSPGLNQVRLGGGAVLLVKSESGVEAFEAYCPHRGASLAHGGRREGDSIVCPFHGRRIGLGCRRAGDDGHVRALPLIDWGGLIFVGPAEGARDTGLAAFVAGLEADWTVIPGFTLAIDAAPEWVIENAFDMGHFQPVHGVLGVEPFVVDRSGGGYAIESVFTLPPSLWQTAAEEVQAGFAARAFSPTLVISRIDGARPYQVITSAIDQGGRARVFLSIALPRAVRAVAAETDYLLSQMRAGLEQDRPIWENLAAGQAPRFGPEDEAVIGFRDFCRQFGGDRA